MYPVKQKIERIIVILKILSKINKNEKIMFRNKNIYIQPAGLITTISRHIHGDNRYEALNGISDLLEELEGLTEECKGLDIETIQRLCEGLNNCISDPGRGIHNLVETYTTDKATISHLESYIERMSILSKTISKYLVDKV